MKIAQISPLSESVPPRLYGGTERVVSWLTEELVRLGHDVTLFASGDSRTSAELVAVVPTALRLDVNARDPLPYNLMTLDRVIDRASEFDVMHFHCDYLQYLFFRFFRGRMLTTLHGRLDLPDLLAFHTAFPEMPLISISNSQRAPMPYANWTETVHHGLPENLYSLGKGSGNYLLFLGRVSPEKGVETAIEIAERAGMSLKIAAKVDVHDRDYFERAVKPLLGHPLVDFIGEVTDREKQALLGNALALLFPINWPEPFGLVMIEAMACGTPVIAYRNGSVPEILEHGVTGFIVENVDEAIAVLPQAGKLSRAHVRQRYLARFTASTMARQYLAIYKRIDAARREAAKHAA